MSQTGVYGTGARRAARRSGASGSDTQESLSSGPMPYISGKQAFLELLKQEGVSVMFGNPGTTELPLMDGLAREPAIHYVLALQEAVAIAMADGYAQASGGIAAANVHVSPGLGNAMGMLYDAMKSGAPLLLTAGQHDQSFTVTEPILWADLPPIAQPFVKWSTEARRLEDLPRIVHRAAKTALTHPTGPVFLSLPVDVLNSERDLDLTAPTRVARRIVGDRGAIAEAARLLANAERPLLVSGDAVAHGDALAEPGKNHPPAVAIQGDPKATLPELGAAVRRLTSKEGHPDAPRRRGAVRAAWESERAELARRAEAEAARVPIQPLTLVHELARRAPANAVIVDESISSAQGVRHFFGCADAKSFFGIRGGGIGWGLPAALGVKLALRDRPVLALVGDGSAMYTNQALWTAARESLAVVYVIFNNASYRILKQRTRALKGFSAEDDRYVGMDLEPLIDFVGMARALGVPGERVEKTPEIAPAIGRAFASSGPYLIDVRIDPAFT